MSLLSVPELFPKCFFRFKGMFGLGIDQVGDPGVSPEWFFFYSVKGTICSLNMIVQDIKWYFQRVARVAEPRLFSLRAKDR